MKSSITLLLINCFIISCSTSSNIKENTSLLSEFLEPRSYQFDILDSVVMSNKQNELQIAFQKAYTEKLDSFNLYFKNRQDKNEPIFPKNNFISKIDFEEYLDFIENLKIISSGNEGIKISKNDNQILFEAKNKLKIFNLIKYNIESNSFEIDNYKLSLKDTISASAENKMFKEAWNGYSWEYSSVNPDEFEIPTSETINELTITRYKVIVGKLEKSDKIIIEITLQDFKNGTQVMNYDLTIKEQKSL